jgi:uncharacterized membrane protein YhiD involved in acid resistance
MDSVLEPLEVALRLLAATLAGLVLGFTRDLKRKPTGMRTLALVALERIPLKLHHSRRVGSTHEPRLG